MSEIHSLQKPEKLSDYAVFRNMHTSSQTIIEQLDWPLQNRLTTVSQLTNTFIGVLIQNQRELNQMDHANLTFELKTLFEEGQNMHSILSMLSKPQWEIMYCILAVIIVMLLVVLAGLIFVKMGIIKFLKHNGDTPKKHTVGLIKNIKKTKQPCSVQKHLPRWGSDDW